MHIRYLEYLIALDHERHFARAAASCNVSQPTLSAGLVSLEAQLGKRLVERERRFIGLTPEGEAVLPWAKQVIAAHSNLVLAAGRANKPLSGEVRIGCIPAAMPVIGYLAQALQAAHAEVTIACHSMTSEAVLRGIRTFELDVGITYVDNAIPPEFRVLGLYRDRFVLLTDATAGLPDGTPVTIRQAIEHRLCLLPQSMQNRRILDDRLARHGCSAQPVITADSFDALFAIVSGGGCSAFIPESYRSMVPGNLKVLSIVPPLASATIGLVLPGDKLPAATSGPILAVAESLALPAQFDPV